MKPDFIEFGWEMLGVLVDFGHEHVGNSRPELGEKKAPLKRRGCIRALQEEGLLKKGQRLRLGG